MSNGRKAIVFYTITQLIFFIFFVYFVRYEDMNKNNNDQEEDYKNFLKDFYLFQDVQVMIFAGFGLILSFLKKFGFSAMGFNFFLGALFVQWGMVCQGFFNLENFKITISVKSLLEGEVAVATLLISACTFLGQATLPQLVLMGIIELLVYHCNSYLGYKIFQVADAGASIFVHTFGAYFGLSVNFILNRFKKKNEIRTINENEKTTYISDMLSLLGTCLLWLFWPSFNAAELSGIQQYRAIINTYLALAASCVSTFIISAIFTPKSKFDLAHIQNASLAGGVAIGAVANMLLQPHGALFIGFLSGILSVVGFKFLTPWIERVTGIHDLCGVHNLHGIPGVLSAIASIVLSATASVSNYDLSDLYQVFPGRAPNNNEILPNSNATYLGEGRSALRQAEYQLVALIVTLAVSIITGLITGLLMNSMCVSLYNISPDAEYNDAIFWKMEEEEEANDSNRNKLNKEEEQIVISVSNNGIQMDTL